MKTTFNPVPAGALVEAAKHLYLTFRIITRNYLFFLQIKNPTTSLNRAYLNLDLHIRKRNFFSLVPSLLQHD